MGFGTALRIRLAEATVKINVTGRHMGVTDVMREYALGKADRLTRYFENLQRVEIIFNPEKGTRYSAEVIVHAPRGSVLVVHATEATATAALDTALEKMERHLSKLKDKLRRKNGRHTPARKLARSSAEDAGGEDSGEIWW